MSVNFHKYNDLDISPSIREAVTKIVNNLDDIGDYKCIQVSLDGGIDIGMSMGFSRSYDLEFDNAGSYIEGDKNC